MHEIVAGLDVHGGVIMDLSPVSEKSVAKLRHLLPSRWSEDMKELIVSPTTHFCMGGVITDKNTETSVPGLFAAGEVCVGVHGANRLSGNALTEVFAMGGIAGRKAALKAKEMGPPEMPKEEISNEKAHLESLLDQTGKGPKPLYRSLREVMWYKAGILRHRKGLEEALGRIEELRSIVPVSSVLKGSELMRNLELQNMLLISEMICRAALMRTESRGSHYRSDFPEEDNTKWLKNIVIRKEDPGMRLENVPVPLEAVMPEGLETPGGE